MATACLEFLASATASICSSDSKRQNSSSSLQYKRSDASGSDHQVIKTKTETGTVIVTTQPQVFQESSSSKSTTDAIGKISSDPQSDSRCSTKDSKDGTTGTDGVTTDFVALGESAASPVAQIVADSSDVPNLMTMTSKTSSDSQNLEVQGSDSESVLPDCIIQNHEIEHQQMKKIVINTVVSDFDLKETLGTGSFSRIRLATTKNQEPFAMKILRKSDIVQLAQEKHTISERDVLVKLRHHPFVVKLYKTYQDSRFLYMLLEFVPGGEIFTVLRRMEKFSKEMTFFYTAQLVLAFEYFHSFSIAYRDTKPENFLIDVNGYLRIVDFGFAKECSQKTMTLCGTPEYLAPEILLGSGHDYTVDWWSLGIFVYEMLVGTPPFVAESLVQMYRKIIDAQIEVWPEDFVPFERDLICGLLVSDPIVRSGICKNIREQNYFYDTPWDNILRKEIVAPYIPEITSPTDTRNYEIYPDSGEHQDEVIVDEGMFSDFEIIV